MSSILSFVDHNKLRFTNYLLLPFSAVFFILSQLRVWCYKVGVLKTSQAEVPVIVVGNITVGGTGKTPILIALCRYFELQGKSIGVGYPRSKNNLFREINRGVEWIFCNDAVGLSSILQAELKKAQSLVVEGSVN